jgi:hypothetical protein
MRLISYSAIILCFFISSCQEDKNFTEYKMYSYESKAYVDSADFPLIRIVGNTKVEIIKPKEKFEGDIIDKDERKLIRLSDGNEMQVEFSKDKTEMTVYSLVDINVEAKFGSFKIVE